MPNLIENQIIYELREKIQSERMSIEEAIMWLLEKLCDTYDLRELKKELEDYK